MLRKISLLLYIVLSGYCTGYSNSFKITIDTIPVHIGSIFGPAASISISSILKQDHKYYCIFHEFNPYTFAPSSEHCLVLSETGALEHNIPLPETNLNETNFRLLHKDNRIILRANDHQYFELNRHKYRWKMINESNQDGYEDKHYRIRHISFGEWGATTWFIDKQSNKEYEMKYNGGNVILLNGVYYITGSNSVAAVKNPANLKEAPQGSYDYAQKNHDQVFIEGSSSLKGVEYLYYDGTFPPYHIEEPKTRIITSIQSSGTLYQLYNDGSNTYIGVLQQGKIIPVQYLDRRFDAYEAVRNNQGNYRLLKFDTDHNNSGIIEITDNNIHIQYFRYDLHPLSYQGPDRFQELLQMLLQKDRPDTAYIQMAESAHKSTEIQPDKEEHNPPSSAPDIRKEFVRLQDSVFALHTTYKFGPKNGHIHSATFEWQKVAPQKLSWNRIHDSLFIHKQEQLRIILMNAFGPPQKQSDATAPLYWQLPDGRSITLEGPIDPFDALRVEVQINWLKN